MTSTAGIEGEAMKITLVTHHFLPRYNAGAELYVYRIALELQRQGHSIDVVCIESITEGTSIPTCKMDIYEGLPVHRLYFDIEQAPDPFEWSFRNPELGRWFKDFLQRSHPDVVHINSGYLLGGTVPESAFELNIPSVLTLHDYWFICPLITLLRTNNKVCDKPASPAHCVWCHLSQKRRYHLLDKRLRGCLGDIFVRLSQSQKIAAAINAAPNMELIAERRSYLKQILETIDLVISPSKFVIQKITEYGLSPRQTIHLPFGLDRIHSSNPQLSKPSGKLRIGYLGQFKHHKGVHLVLKAFQKLVKRPGSCELVLHGEMSGTLPYERKLLQVAKGDSDIKFAGPYPNYQVSQILNALDIIVVPSIWYENRPTVIVEAFAAQTPVIAARLGGMAELIQHNKNGLLFEVGSVDSLARQMQRLLDEPALLPQLCSSIEPMPTIEGEVSVLVSMYEALSAAREKKAS